jgi:hypothetical protein
MNSVNERSCVERDGLALYYQVPALGSGVADGLVELLRCYATRAGLQDLPPITLGGPGWDQSWDACLAHVGFSGSAGSSYEESRRGINNRALYLNFTANDSCLDTAEGPRTLERTIAHEITHLRWWSLRHGFEFSARVRALMAGAKFSRTGGWARRTQEIVNLERSAVRAWFDQRFRAHALSAEAGDRRT